MDWKKTFNRGQWVIHAVLAFSVLLSVGSTILALRLNHLQNTEEERTLKINSLLQDLRTDRSFEKLGKFLTRAESEKANDKIRELSRRLAEAEELLEYKVSKDLGLSMRTFNKLINSNSGMSDPGDALKVLAQKISQLKDIAQSQNYKNVGIIADRMKGRVSSLTSGNVGRSPQVGYLRSDLKRLEQLVSGSTLSEGEKSSLAARFKGMENEIELLSALNGHSRDLQAHVKAASLALGQWALDAEKKTGDLKGLRFKKQNQLVILLAAMAGFLILSWVGLAYLFRWQKVRMGGQVEMEVKSVIEKGILGDQRFMVDHYSELTREDIIKLLDGLKVKLNLGTMLHEGLPFAGCMIDNTFKLTWFNHLFLEQFYLSEDEVRSDAFGWDFLRECLNLDSDPVYEAMVNKIAGIYPVKVKQDEFTPMQPYEMYVTPIMVNREDRVMVFFYPLVSVKEAIVEQVNLAKDAVNRFVELWNDERLEESELQLLEKDFKGNDLADLFETLREIHQRVDAEKAESLKTIASLEKENGEQFELIEELRRISEEKRKLVKRELGLTAELKRSFLKTLEKSDSLFQLNRSVLQQNDELKTEAQKILQVNQEFLKKTRETSEIMTQLEAVKVDYKKLKLELLEVKAKLISLNTSLMGQLPPLDENQQKLALRHKDELARLDFNVCTFDKKLSQLDVLLGKLSMMHERSPAQQTNFNFQTTQRDHETREALTEIQKALGAEEGKIVEHFNGLHELMRQELGRAATEVQANSESLLS